ncbi:MAG TPA: N-acetyltransferase [Acidimicrobiaceae bacterium]|nr:N-acetyltransferase [Acidimicrobiaceae bacterium]
MIARSARTPWNYSSSDVVKLNASVGWFPERTEDDYAEALARGPAVGAWRSEQLVGFARAITDGAIHAYVDDVMVHPEHRREGLAVQLVDALCDAIASVRTVTLFCGEDLVPLYERASFTRTQQVILHRQHPRQ